jgi:predicted amidohydrolase
MESDKLDIGDRVPGKTQMGQSNSKWINMKSGKFRILIILLLVVSAFFLVWHNILPLLLMPGGPGKDITLATTSMRCVADSRENIRNLLHTITLICDSNRNVDLILFGEAILTRYVLDPAYLEEHVLDLNGPAMDAIKKAARRYGVYLSFGAFIHHQKQFYNAQIVINREGHVVLIHRKANLTSSEKNVFQPGTDPVSYFLLDGINVGQTICYDIEHPRVGKQIRLHRPRLLLHSLADPNDPYFVTGSTGRKANCWYACANRFGKEGDTRFNGFMAFINPLGKVLDLEHDRPGYLIRSLTVPEDRSDTLWMFGYIYNSISRLMHLVRYPGKVIDYLKWDRKMRLKKNLPVPIYEKPVFFAAIITFFVLLTAGILLLKHKKRKKVKVKGVSS